MANNKTNNTEIIKTNEEPIVEKKQIEKTPQKKKDGITIQSFLDNFQSKKTKRKELKYLIPGFSMYVSKNYPNVRVKTFEEWEQIFNEYSQKGE